MMLSWDISIDDLVNFLACIPPKSTPPPLISPPSFRAVNAPMGSRP